ncbi:MAG: transposase, partial [Hymenobacter sp.]
FMTDLPPCEGFDAIMVVVDRFTKMAHYVPTTKDVSAEGVATLYVNRRYHHHGMPEHIITNRGAQFKSEFWSSFFNKLGVNIRMSTAYHPETDGQTERVNSVLNQYLRVYCNLLQDNWVQLLPLAEFAYNNSVHSATMVTPFMANYGINPATDLSKSVSLTDVPNELSERMKCIDEFLRGNLEHARATMKHYADRHREESIKYRPGDKVLLSLQNIKT